MREKPDRTSLLTAYHEAGHAVVAIRLGRRVRLVMLEPDHKRRHGACLLDPIPSLASLRRIPEGLAFSLVRDDILITLAGEAAESRFAEVEQQFLQSASPEILLAKRRARCVCGDEREAVSLLFWLSEKTRNLIQSKPIWRSIVAVAERLVETGSLTARDLRKLCQPGKKPAAKKKPKGKK